LTSSVKGREKRDFRFSKVRSEVPAPLEEKPICKIPSSEGEPSASSERGLAVSLFGEAQPVSEE